MGDDGGASGPQEIAEERVRRAPTPPPSGAARPRAPCPRRRPPAAPPPPMRVQLPTLRVHRRADRPREARPIRARTSNTAPCCAAPSCLRRASACFHSRRPHRSRSACAVQRDEAVDIATEMLKGEYEANGRRPCLALPGQYGGAALKSNPPASAAPLCKWGDEDMQCVRPSPRGRGNDGAPLCVDPHASLPCGGEGTWWMLVV